MGGNMVAGTGLGNKVRRAYCFAQTVLKYYVLQFALPANPQRLGSFAYEGRQEADDELHNPSAHDDDFNVFSGRGLANVGCLLFLCVAILALL